MEFEKLSDKHGRKMSKIAVLIILALIVLCSCRTEAFLKQRYTTFRHAPAKPVASRLVSHKPLPAESPESLRGVTSEAESKERIPLASDQENLSAPHSFPGRGGGSPDQEYTGRLGREAAPRYGGAGIKAQRRTKRYKKHRAYGSDTGYSAQDRSLSDPAGDSGGGDHYPDPGLIEQFFPQKVEPPRNTNGMNDTETGGSGFDVN